MTTPGEPVAAAAAAAVAAAADDGDDECDPSLAALVNDTEIKWVFVGGKGGVGKTTTSCSLALQFAAKRGPEHKVLLISTDPAHNLSDAFQQRFSDEPTAVTGVPNLYAMETDPRAIMDKQAKQLVPDDADASQRDMFAQLKDAMQNMPGVDEAMSFAELMKQVKTLDFSVTIFDTAPTGHTLRLLSLPETLEKAMGGLFDSGMGAALRGMMGGMGGGGGGGGGDPLGALKAQVADVHAVFKNPSLTTFVCVMIPEFLSLFETERLIQSLAGFEIDCQYIVVNQVLYPESAGCGLCSARAAMQRKYLDQADALYADFHLVRMPLLHAEVRGVAALRAFSNHLVTPFEPPTPQ